MVRTLKQRKTRTMYFLVISTLMAFCFSSLGCEPLRKKFTRKKKKDSAEKFSPVFDPIDYPKVVHSSEERYKYHYSMWKVWYRDLITTIDERGNEKRQRYLVDQMLAQLTEMKKWVTEDKQKELSIAITDLQKIGNELEEPALMRNLYIFKNRLETNAKKIQNDLNPQRVENHFVHQM